MLKQYKLVAGFTLIEILAALVIVSVGLLGVATLQVRGQQFNQVAYFRTQATFLAQDMMERIRINSDRTGNGITGNADDGGYATYSPDPMGDTDGCPTINQDCDSTQCGPAALTQYDLAQWCERLQEFLPAAEAQITWNDPKDETYTIKICWANLLDGANDNCEIKINNDKEGQSWTFQPF
ncbi:Type IV fimbrial biogenesis protein PilV [Beggiatoa sp. PS]|nr:Type IV fimbrial biogenesis protein PilV [Beggiatoa sp. PS]